MDYYIYQDGRHVRSFETREQAVKWARWQLYTWRISGSPHVPHFTAHYNGLVKNEPEVITEN